MVFSKIAEIISASASRLSATQSSTIPYVSSGLSPQASSGYSYGFPSTGQKRNLRLSSSLQDFSAYRRLDPEEADLGLEADRAPILGKQAHPLQEGETGGLSFSKEKGLSTKPFVWKKFVRALVVLLCLLLFASLLYIASIYFYPNWSREASKFYVVLDSGSTGTRAYVYKAHIALKKDGSFPIILSSFAKGPKTKPSSRSGRAYDRMETEPGLDKLVNNISGLKAAIKPLLHWAEKQIPKHAHKTTSLFLYATAGVRRLPKSDSDWLLHNARSIMKASPFLCREEWVKIISGMEEAYFGWIALNYHTRTLGSSHKQETFGALDLGGSSLQVTFENQNLVSNETNLHLKIGAVNHHLNAYSLPGYGLNDAFDKSVAHLLKKLPESANADLLNEKIELRHPCLHSGYKEQYVCSHCMSRFQEGQSPLVGGRNLGKGGKPGINIGLIGAPKWDECVALAKVAVNLSEWSDQSPGLDCEVQPCSLSDSSPRPYGKFYAMSGFFVVYRFFNLTSEAMLDDVLEKGQQFCEKTWDVAKNSVAPQPFIEQYCFRAPYIVLLLREGLHITDNQVTIGSGSITWTFGVALLEAGNSFPPRIELPRYEILRMKINPVILFAILAVSLIFLLCALSYVGNWIPRSSRRPYLPLFRHNNASTTSVLNIPSPFRFQRWSPISLGKLFFHTSEFCMIIKQCGIIPVYIH